MHDFELIQYLDNAKDGIDLKARWYDGDQQYSISVFVPQYYKSLFDYSYQVKYAFASQMKDYPIALKQCLTYLDNMFGVANYYYNDVYSAELSDPIMYNSYQTLSVESQNIWDKTYNQSMSIDATKKLTVDFELTAEQFENYKNIFNKVTPPANPIGEKKSLSSASYDLPGIKEHVEFPCGEHEQCATWKNKPRVLHSTIMQLNDNCKWSREEIADWLETLDVDLTFKTNTKEMENVEG